MPFCFLKRQEIVHFYTVPLRFNSIPFHPSCVYKDTQSLYSQCFEVGNGDSSFIR